MRTTEQFEDAARDMLTDEDIIVGEVEEAGDAEGVYVTARIFVRYTDDERAEAEQC